MRGKDPLLFFAASAGKGSPPRMRGKACIFWPSTVFTGITPAHAGKRSTKQFFIRKEEDHPRACGEKCKNRTGIQVRLGSPPRMRGKEETGAAWRWLMRITPAHAGKSGRISGPTRPGSGSPPRMRGKVLRYGRNLHRTGITPAHAGKSSSGFTLLYVSRDHPRACGEKSIRILRMWERTGSPPRMRGKADGRRAARTDGRITPAHAGKRSRW